MKIALTGSDGFIGTHLLKHLYGLNHDVIEIDLALGYDISDWESISSIKDFDVLIHLAAKSFVPEAFNKPIEFYRTNVLGTLNALELCRLNNAKMIFISSYVYGDPEYLPIDEAHPTKAFNPYAQSKLIGEDLCKAYFRDYGVTSCIFRPFNIYGPRQAEHYLIPLIIKQARTGKIALKDPRPKRDFIYIDDVVNAIGKSLELKLEGVEIFNLGSGVSTSISEIIYVLQKLLDRNLDVQFTNERRKGEVLETIADLNKIKSILGWNPRFNLLNGLQRLI